jgi:hypothetical protein
MLTPAPVELWRAAAAEDPSALADHLPEWTRASCASGRWEDISRLYVLDDGSHVVLPLLRLRRTGPAVWAASMPTGHGFGGLVGRRSHDASVVRAVLGDLASLGWASIRLRPDPAAGPAWADAEVAGARTLERRAHLLRVDDDLDATLARMRKSTRRIIRRSAERDDITVDRGNSPTLIADYLALWWSSVDRWAQDQREPLWLSRRRAVRRDPPRRLFSLAEHLDDRLDLWVARLGGRVAAANVAATANAGHVIRAAMDRDLVRSSGLMQHLDWLTIRHAHERGVRTLNLGESGVDSTLAAYKEGLGAEAVAYAEVRLERVPITPVDHVIRSGVKRAIGFRG